MEFCSPKLFDSIDAKIFRFIFWNLNTPTCHSSKYVNMSEQLPCNCERNRWY